MRIRRCANLLLGAAVSVSVSGPPRFELPPPSPRFELPPPAHESHAGFAPKTSSFSPEPCPKLFSPWDLFDQLDLSDPQEEEQFMETYSVPVARRASWLLAPIMPAGSINNDDEEDMVNVVNDEEEEDMVNGSILEPCVPRDVGRKTTRKKEESKPKTKKGKEKAEESDDSGEGERVSWTCKKNDGKRWFCRRPVSQPDSLCSYHSDPKLPGSSKPRRKRATTVGNAGHEGFYYYAGFGPSRGKRHRGSSSRSVLGPPPAEEQTPGQAQADGADGVDDEPRCDDDGIAGIAGCDEEISSDDDDGEPARDVKRRKRKPVKARSINSLM